MGKAQRSPRRTSGAAAPPGDLVPWYLGVVGLGAAAAVAVGALRATLLLSLLAAAGVAAAATAARRRRRRSPVLAAIAPVHQMCKSIRVKVHPPVFALLGY